jgi:23S rRNA (adenine2503-C2)-methyltransferase
VRDWIVPVNRRHKLPALMDVLRRHYGSGNSLGRRVLVEYTMLAGVNDSVEDAARLLELLEGVDAKVRGGGRGGCGLCSNC